MSGWLWVVLVLIVVVAVICVGFALGARRQRLRTAHLRDRFGSEYESVTAGTSGEQRRAAEAQLERREMRREHLDLRSLPVEDRQRYQSEWQGIQSNFVDEPTASIADAEQLVNRIMRDRGYPVAGDFDDQAELISVDHPELVSNYRQAHGVYERSQRHEADTEEIRNSLVYYRSLIADLLAA